MADGSSQLWDGGPSSSAWPVATPLEPPCAQPSRAGPSSELPSEPMAVDNGLDEEPTLQSNQQWDWAVGDEYQQSNFGEVGEYARGLAVMTR